MKTIDRKAGKRINKKGGTLVTVIFASLILQIAVLNAIGAAQGFLNISHYQKSKSVAGAIAENIMERLQFSYQSDTDLTEGTHAELFDDKGSLVVSDEVYTAQWIVNRNTPIDKVHRIELTISWTHLEKTSVLTVVSYRR